MAEIKNISMAGVGGQGIVMAGNVIALAAMAAGYDVKKNEIHGMAQRGGSVISEVRFGGKVFSPVVPDGEVDVLVALELLEGLRHAHRLRKDGLIIANRLSIKPAVKPPGAPDYPADVEKRLQRAAGRVIVVPAAEIAQKAGHARAANTVLLGILSRHIDLPREVWHKALEAALKASVLEINLRAFDMGRRIRRGQSKRQEH